MAPGIPDISNMEAASGHLELRDLEDGDLNKGFRELLGQLTTVGTVNEEVFLQRFSELKENGDYKIVVAEDMEQGKLVGTATLLIERKFIHSCGKVGHVEDVVVDTNCRGQKLGQRLILRLAEEARSAGCYKVILDCGDHNVGFYEKCGFEKKGAEMAKYFEG